MNILSLVALAALSLTVSGQTPLAKQSPGDPRPFLRVERIGEANARSFFVFATNERKYTIRHDGLCESYAAKGLRKYFHLKMGAGGRLERVHFLERESDLLMLYEVTEGKSDLAYLLRVDQRTLKLKWITAVNAINIGPALVEGEDGYLTATNFVARIDLVSGKYVWQFSDFDAQEFQLPVLTSDRVLLREDKEEGREIAIDKASGRMVGKE